MEPHAKFNRNPFSNITLI